MTRREKLIRKRKIQRMRRTRFLCILTIMAVGILAFAQLASAGTKGEPSYETISVQKGDTLWSIASRHNESGKEMRKLIAEIKDINGMESSEVYQGDVIKIPY